MDKHAITYDEYLELLKNEVETLKIKRSNLTIKNDTFANCCTIVKKNNEEVVIFGIDKMINLFKTNNGKEEFKNLLKYIFGDAFFKEFSKEEKADYKKQGFFTKDDLPEVLGSVYGIRYGYLFKNPNSWDEMVEFLSNCANVCCNTNLNESQKEAFYKILLAFNKLIESSYANSVALKREINFIISIYNEFILGLENKRKIKINMESYDLIRNILNKDDRKFIMIDDDLKEIGFGDAFITFCKLYNNDVESLANKDAENKERLKTKMRAQKYYKRITSIPFDKLENKYFPKYTNKNYVVLIKKVIDMLLNDLKSDEKWLPYYTATIMHYASYFKTKYYDEEKFEKENVKTYETKSK